MKSYDPMKVQEILQAGENRALCEELRYLTQRMTDLECRLDYLNSESQWNGECWESAETLSHVIAEDLPSVAAVLRVMHITEESIADLLWTHEREIARQAKKQVPGQLSILEVPAAA